MLEHLVDHASIPLCVQSLMHLFGITVWKYVRALTKQWPSAITSCILIELFFCTDLCKFEGTQKKINSPVPKLFT